MNNLWEADDYFINGRSAMNANNFDLALLNFRKVLKINPDDLNAHHDIIRTLISMKRYKQAQAKLRWPLQETKKNSNYQQMLFRFLYGRICLEQKKYKQAKRQFRIGLRIDKAIVTRCHNLGIDFSEEGSYEKAVTCFEAINKKVIAQKHLTVNCLGYTYFLMGKFKLAIKQYENALRLDPGYFLSYINYSLLLFCEKKYKESEEMLSKGVKAGTSYQILKVKNTYQLEIDKLEKKFEDEKNIEKAEFMKEISIGMKHLLVIIDNQKSEA